MGLPAKELEDMLTTSRDRSYFTMIIICWQFIRLAADDQ